MEIDCSIKVTLNNREKLWHLQNLFHRFKIRISLRLSFDPQIRSTDQQNIFFSLGIIFTLICNTFLQFWKSMAKLVFCIHLWIELRHVLWSCISTITTYIRNYSVNLKKIYLYFNKNKSRLFKRLQYSMRYFSSWIKIQVCPSLQ